MARSGALLELRKFVVPEIVFGAGARELVGRYAQSFAARRVLLVSDPGVIAAGWTAQAELSLQRAGLDWVRFEDLTPNPKDFEAQRGTERYLQEGCDLLVAVGGGSVIDCAKGIGILAVNGGQLELYEGIDEIPSPGPPLICVPTTAGSSADVSQFAVLTNVAQRRKMALVSKMLVPDVALVDPETTTTMWAELTCHTGLDALTHAFEAYVSTTGSAVTDLHALAAVRHIAGSLVEAVQHPQAMAARASMMLGSLLAGLAFSNASLGMVHAMAHALGGQFDLVHGRCNALLLRQVVAFNFAAVPERYRDLGEALGLQLAGLGEDEVKERLLEKLRQLATEAGLTPCLPPRELTQADLAALADSAVRDLCMASNPVPATREEIETVYAAAFRTES